MNFLLFCATKCRRSGLAMLVARFYSTSQHSRFDKQNIPCSHAKPTNVEFENAIKQLQSKLFPTKLIRVLEQLKDTELALEIFNWTSNQKGFKHNGTTYSLMIERLGFVGRFGEMQALLDEILNKSCPRTEGIFVIVIKCYCQAQMLDEALKVLETMKSIDCGIFSVIPYNILLNAFAMRGNFQSVCSIYIGMVEAGILPDVVTMNTLINTLCEANQMEATLKRFHHMKK